MPDVARSSIPIVLTAVLLAVLATSCGSSEGSAPGAVPFHDSALGLSGEYPDGWYRAHALTNMADPREVLALASYPLRGRDSAGECAPKTALSDLPRDGAFTWLIEYRPARGDVWADLPRDRFPPKPEPFHVSATNLETGLCQSGPGYGMTFRAANRPFQLLVAFGAGATNERMAEVEAILNSLRFDPVAPPPPDPYAGWPLVSDDAGDSLRPPPGWPGAAVNYRTRRPHLLFFVSNRPLWGLPRTLVPRVDDPAAGDEVVPTGALANEFPSDGVVLFVLEEAPGGPPAEFPPIGRGWPARADFGPGEMATEPAPELRWLKAAGSFAGFRFSVWIGRAPRASDRDLALALKSAASLALSGCRRDADDDCPDG